MVTSTENACRIGLMSRIDFPSDGFRRGLLELAKADFKREDVHFVILAGGLIDSRYVTSKSKKLWKLVKGTQRQIKAVTRQISETEGRIAELKDERKSVPKKLTEELAKLKTELAALAETLGRYEAYLAELEPEKIAEQLSKLLPVFVNGNDETVKLYIFPSPAYDGDLGEEVAQRLAELRPDDVRVYQSGGDRLFIKQANKDIEVLVPSIAVWMRGDYFSTPIERLIKDRRRQMNRELPALFMAGCFGSTITKPKGEAPVPFVAAPVLHRLDKVRVSENQIGVRVVTVIRDRTDPVTRNFSYKDYVQDERSFISPPRELSPRRQKVLEAIKERGRMTAGLITDLTGLTRQTVEAELAALQNKSGRRPKNWPGLRFYKQGRLWDYDGYWVRENLLYPAVPREKSVSEGIVAFGCLHAGAIATDYPFILEHLPRVVLEKDADIIVAAGDLVEGTKHGLLVKGEVYAGMNTTTQEIFAGKLLAECIVNVFNVRFAKASEALGPKPTHEDVLKAVGKALPLFLVIPGNHDDWAREFGFTPLVVMKLIMMDRIREAVDAALAAKGLCSNRVAALVASKVVEPPKGEFTLPSGLKMTIMHPHMGRTKTTSIRPQEMLDKAEDSQIVIGANFHVAEHLEVWDGKLGQRMCLELGTAKRHSDFEDHKLKTVDHGFGYIRFDSVDGRIVSSESAFYTAPPTKGSTLDGSKVFRDLLEAHGLTKK